MRMRTGIVLLLVLIGCTLGCLGETEDRIPLSGQGTVAENERLRLDYDVKAGNIAVYDKLTGETWYSTPTDYASDKIASGANKINLQSDLILEYHNESYATNKVNSYTGSIKKGDFKAYAIENGVEIEYDFPKQNIKIPVQYVLDGECFCARILCERIEQTGKFTLMDVALLPYFGCGGLNDEGYIVIPDGSGALIRFNNGKSAYPSYSQMVYGRDDCLSYQIVSISRYALNMPVYGIVRNGYGMLAVVSEGECQCEIKAAVSGKICSYNNVYSAVRFLSLESNSILSGTAYNKTVVLPTNQTIDYPVYEVRYYFDDAKDGGYAGLAALYREYLERNGVKRLTEHAEDAPVEVEFIAGVPSTSTFLGIPYESVQKLTGYDTLVSCCESLLQKQIRQLYVRYTGWSLEGMRGKLLTGIAADGRLGGWNAFETMRGRLADMNVTLSLNIDLVNLYRDGNGYIGFIDGTRNVNSTALQVYAYKRTSSARDGNLSPWYYLSPNKVPGLAEKFASDAEKKSIDSVTLQSLGNMLYSSFGKGNISRLEAGEYWNEALQKLTGRIKNLFAVMPSAYMFPYINAAFEIPVYSSGYSISDESIPFYQMVTHGNMLLFSEPLNESANIHDEQLRLIEYGVYPAYRMVGENADRITFSDYEEYFASDLGMWQDQIADTAAFFQPLARLSDQLITGHERLSDSLSVTVYEDGTSVLVNYGSEPAEIMGITVDARSYAVKEAREQ